MSCHVYADDTQINLLVKRGYGSSATHLQDCLREIKAWMPQSFLNFNETKTELIIFDPEGTYDASLNETHSLKPWSKAGQLNWINKLTLLSKPGFYSRLNLFYYFVILTKWLMLLFQYIWTTEMYFALA